MGKWLLAATPRPAASVDAPNSERLLVNSSGAFFALGSILGGVLASRLIPTWGWQSTFYVGGVVPLLFVPFLVVRLPESIRFLTLSGLFASFMSADAIHTGPSLHRCLPRPRIRSLAL